MVVQILGQVCQALLILANSADKLMTFFLIFSRKLDLTFHDNNFKEMLKHILGKIRKKKNFKMQSAEIFAQHAEC